MDKKIAELFKYRKLPFLLNKLKKKDKTYLKKELVEIQKAIYFLDAYLESNWKLKEKKLTKLWLAINKSILKLGFDSDEVTDLTAHIRKYQLHEQQLRENKLPTRLKLDYYYYYKSCDVRLMREIIYAFNPDISVNLPMSDWRIYDLVTEINDDIEDVFEDQYTINGNCFLISINEFGLDKTIQTFTTHLNLLLEKSVTKFSKSKKSEKLRIHFYTIKRIEETILLLNVNAEKIKKKGLKKKIILFKYLT